MAEVEKRLVEDAVVLKKFVVVALVPVAFTNVKFWRVEDAVAKMLAKVPSAVEVRFPPLAVVKKRFVELAVVLKKLVVVALVVVELPETRSELLNSNWSAEEFQVRRAFGDTEPLSNDR